jgi:hypothetical protein
MMKTREALVADAVDHAGLSDFGSDGWQDGLDRLVAAVDTDIGDDAQATARIEAMLTGRLVQRLRVEQWYGEHGREADAPVQGPVVIVGLPRSATTALQYLLARDPQFRFVRPWEVNEPVPPPDLATEHDDPRRLRATSRPNVRHISSTDGPIEDGAILGLHFRSQELALPVPSYARWWRTADLEGACAYHDRTLRLLQSHRPPHLWLMKGPAYLFHLRPLARQYPNARFLFTHRDPAASMPSTCSTVMDAWTLMVPSVTVAPTTVGRNMLEHYVEGMQRAMSARDELGDDRFLDVAQCDVEHDPIGTAERIYAFLELELTDHMRSEVETFASENRRGARGEHAYTPEQFGYSVDGIRDAFGDYLDRYASYTTPEDA